MFAYEITSYKLYEGCSCSGKHRHASFLSSCLCARDHRECSIQRVGPGTVGGLVDLLRAIVRWTYIVFFILGIFFILIAAFTYLFARGDEAKVKTARNMLLYAAVAFIVAFLAVGFETIIGTFLTNPSA